LVTQFSRWLPPVQDVGMGWWGLFRAVNCSPRIEVRN
jgi:hypothetical protein